MGITFLPWARGPVDQIQTLPFPPDVACSLPSSSCNIARQSRHKNFKFGWDMCVSVWEGKRFFDGFASDLQFHFEGWQLQIVGGQPVSTCCRIHCVLYIKVISRQLLTCVRFEDCQLLKASKTAPEHFCSLDSRRLSSN